MIRRLRPAPPGKRLEYGDALIRGLVLRVTDRSSKSFNLYYYDQRKRHRRFTLGTWPELTIDEAREAAEIAKHHIAAGRDPRTERRRAELQLVDAAIHLFITRHVNKNNKPTTARETIRKLEYYILPAWEGRPITSIERRDVAELIQAITESGAPVMADRVLATISKFFNWAMVQPEYIDILKANPVIRGMSPGRAKKRDRFLSKNEINLLWRVFSEIGYPFGSLAQILLLTGQRRGEVAKMRWAELDLDSAIWHLPAISTKTGNAHDVPLSNLAIDLLSNTPRFNGEFVFTTTGGERPVSGFSKAKARIDGATTTFLPWRFHDLRRTFSTHLEELDVAKPVIGALLNHTNASVTAIYTRAELMRAKRQAMEKYSTLLEGYIHLPEERGAIIHL